MRYRRPPKPDTNVLYKGCYILPDESGEKYGVYDGFGTLMRYPLASIADAQDYISKRYRGRINYERSKQKPVQGFLY